MRNQSIIKNIEATMRRSDKIYSLYEALEYQNDAVVYRFTPLWDVKFAEAKDLFLEAKRWLWLCAQLEEKRLMITTPLLIIDEMWHNFILFSREYMKYCQDYFGRYIHHAPTPYSKSYKALDMNWSPSPEMLKTVSLFKAGKLVIRDL